ncbi:MAG: hypothetical protein P8Q48_20245 [Paracoccaceae bacterium]|nr:hypothetical protein [Paracoccaceae bacterium]MDG1372530.1 hypothetical protein [Paracoccaceae bacterium]
MTEVKDDDAQSRTAEIRRLNDALRTGESGEGTIVITQGVQAGGPVFLEAVMMAVRDFSAFDEDNDPHASTILARSMLATTGCSLSSTTTIRR